MNLKYWWEAFEVAVYLINRLPTPVLQNYSLFEQLYRCFPDHTFLKVFGSTCYPNLRSYNTHKYQFPYERMFLGYSSCHKGYNCLHSLGRILFLAQ